jgi:hypothetical protein
VLRDHRTIRLFGLLLVSAYAALILWVYVRQPRTVAQITGGVAAAVGVYHVDPQHFQEGLRFFRNDQFPEARAAFERADPAHQDAVTQFYVAYSYYRQGWGRLYHDDVLYKQGLEALDRATLAAPAGRVVVADPNLGMHSGDELRVELQKGMTLELSDFNPMRVLEKRK